MEILSQDAKLRCPQAMLLSSNIFTIEISWLKHADYPLSEESSNLFYYEIE